jgi:glyoxylase-like metal-dependent hydrolase (beta-lactamase superfamily II)
MLRIVSLLALLAVSCGDRGGPLPADVRFVEGPVNSLAVEAAGRRVVFYGEQPAQPAEAVLFTHHRRDVVWAGLELARAGATTYGPAAERALFEQPERFWDEFRSSRFHDYAQQSTKILTQSLELDRQVRGGQTLALLDGALQLETLDTPGYTRGAVSYLFERDGRRIAVTGDLIYAGGRLFDLYSLQDSIPEADVRGYHGYAARAAPLISSLRKLAAWNPDLIVPARGPLIDNPAEAIGLLIARLQELFRNHYRTDALRWYWGDDNLRLRAGRVLSDAAIDWMPMARELREIPPRWMHKFNTSRLIVSDDGPAFLIDCGSDAVIDNVEDLRRRGVFNAIEGIFVTHFHDDHTDRVQAMAEKCRCPVYSGPEVQDILERPAAYHMPAMTDLPIASVRALSEGEQLRWREYTFTYTYFPGQAIYHGGLQLERSDGEKFFFVGDSFSPSGLDDYCLLNRHFLHPGWGHFRCLRIIRESDPQFWLVNQHIEPVFRYAPEQIEFMERTLEAKRAAAAELLPWDDPNFGLDEQWLKLYPYGVDTAAGRPFELWAIAFNHSPQTQRIRVAPNAPAGWSVSPASAEINVESLREGRVSFKITPPAEASGLTVLSADVLMGDHDLRQWAEAIVEIARP